MNMFIREISDSAAALPFSKVTQLTVFYCEMKWKVRSNSFAPNVVRELTTNQVFTVAFLVFLQLKLQCVLIFTAKNHPEFVGHLLSFRCRRSDQPNLHEPCRTASGGLVKASN